MKELNAQVIANEGYTEAQQAALHRGGPKTELTYRLAWGRTGLKGLGLIINTDRAVWELTDSGKVVTLAELQALRKGYISGQDRAPEERNSSEDDTDADADEAPWQEQLLDEVRRLSPEDFERLAERLLHREGFINTQVTGRSGDGGIDGQGVYRLSLLSFQVFFQCKRYTGSVSAGAVRDFRGAMAGRGDKGLLITTGTFTKDAKDEATRDGAPPIDLIDGEQLCELLKEQRLGVKVQQQTVEIITINPEFFRGGF